MISRLISYLPAAAFSISTAFVAPVALAQDPQAADFASRIGMLNSYSLQASELARLRAPEGDIQNFATEAISHSRNFAASLRASAAADGIALETELNEEYTQKLQALEAAAPNTFKMAYISAQVTVYEGMVTLLTPYLTDGPAGAMKDFAANHIGGPRSNYQTALDLSRTQAPSPAPVSPAQPGQ